MPPTLDEVLALLPRVHLAASLDARDRDPEIVNLLRFSVEDIIALAGAENLHLDWELEELDDLEAADEPEEPAKPAFAYTTDATIVEVDQAADDDDNPLAVALRKAMQGQG